ncbi:hypothetical protein EV13_2600 [Prochlorococcus sp. MIT 0702]|nr:hypothetical protein EV12_2389 [Prochlorococcus sp. MIT 0701]KGG26465.1 hypothetical protein EV13_2600 [Prochlorococcus sp. MIT 0702]
MAGVNRRVSLFRTATLAAYVHPQEAIGIGCEIPDALQ